jgi:prepilin-type N-terminal cleavage/methylation domain-containing protein
MRVARAGLTIVEVVVALALLAIHLVGWTAAVRLIVVLLQRTASLLAAVDGLAAAEAPDISEWCALGLLMMRLPPRRSPFLAAARPAVAGRRGLTLVEVLVALALSGLVLTLVAGGFALNARFARAALSQGDALSVRLALPAMLQQTVEVAGRGVGEACALAVDPSGHRLTITHLLAGGTTAVEEVFAALDGGGRPALYLRRLPHARQPWLEGVTSFRVVAPEPDAGGRLEALRLEVVHAALSEPLEVTVSLPHQPCQQAPP